MEAGRESANRFGETIQPVWYDLAEEEAILLTIHALAYIADKTAMVSQIKTARRNFRRTVGKLSLNDVSEHKQALQNNDILSRGRSEIKLSEPDYNTDDDLVNAPSGKKPIVMRTRPVRGKGVKTKKQERDMQIAQEIYAETLKRVNSEENKNGNNPHRE